MILNTTSLLISLAALAVATTTLWLTHIRRGKLLLSQPTIFFFGWDKGIKSLPKIMLRSALFCTSKRGVIVENLFLTVQDKEKTTTFSVWGYDDGGGMVRGSGVYVGETGFIAYHHFNPSSDAASFTYSIGEYLVEVKAKIFGENKVRSLGSYRFNVDSNETIDALSDRDLGVMWDWHPDLSKYIPVTRKNPTIDQYMRTMA